MAVLASSPETDKQDRYRPADRSPVGPAPPPSPAFRARRSSMVPVARAPRIIAPNLERVVGSIEEGEQTAARASSEPAKRVRERPVRLCATASGLPVPVEPTEVNSSQFGFLVEEQPQQRVQPEVVGDGDREPTLDATILALKMKQKLTRLWRATISVDMWTDLKQALDILPEHRTLTHCMNIDSWISKVYVLRALGKRQREDICRWIQYRSYETNQKVFERGDSAADGNFYMIFSGTVVVLAPKQEEQPVQPMESAIGGQRSQHKRTVHGAAARNVVQARSRLVTSLPRASYLTSLSSGDSFGELAMIENPDGSENLTRTATVQTQTPCMLLTLPRQRFLESALSFAGHERMAKVRKLRTNLLFESWPLDALLLMSYHCIKKEFDVGDVIIDGNKENAHAYAILAGSCVLTVDEATQMVTDGFFVGADSLFGDKIARSNTGQQAETNQDSHDSPPRYHVVADSTCCTYAVSHEMLRTLVPSAARSILAELGKFRLATLKSRAERRRIRIDSAVAEMTKAAQKQAVEDAEDMRAREAWISAQKRAVALRPPAASMGTSPHLLLNTDATLRDLQRAERSAHHQLLTEAVFLATSDSQQATCVVGERHIDVKLAVQSAAIAEKTVQKLQSSVGSLKAEVIQYRLLMRNAGRYEVHRLSSAVEKLVAAIVEAMRPDTMATTATRRVLSWRKRTTSRSNGNNGSDGRRMATQISMGSTQEMARRRRAWLRQVPIFQILPPDSRFFQVLAAKLTERTVRRKMVVIEKGSVGKEMFFVVQGVADILASLDEPPFATLQPGAHFGEEALLSEQRRNAYVRASTTLKLYVLSKHDLRTVLIEFPDVESVLREYATAEEHRKIREKAEREAAAHALEIDTELKRKSRVAAASAHSVEEIIRNLNLCSRLCSRVSTLLETCVSWHHSGYPKVKDGEVAQEVAQSFAKVSADLKAALSLPIEILHNMLRRSAPRLLTYV